MATYRSVHLSFWTDTKVTDDLTPEDRYFMLYCLTNPHTNIIGCYEISIKQIAQEIGYSKDSVENLLKRFEETHGIIEYCKENKELFVKNWWKYNWTNSPKLDNALLTAIKTVKTDRFRKELSDIYNNRDTVSIPYTYTMDTTDTDNISNNYILEINNIIDYFNSKANKNYKSNTANTQKLIRARLNEGFTVEDFKKIIDTKVAKWKGTDMEEYLRPETLFCPKHFESYLNESGGKEEKTNDIDFLIAKGFSKEWVMSLSEEERAEKRKKWEN